MSSVSSGWGSPLGGSGGNAAHLALYKDVPRVKRYDQTIRISTSGLSKPKFLKCVGNDGQLYHQLCKMDDVKPDAIMQQVFTFVNRILARASGSSDEYGEVYGDSDNSASDVAALKSLEIRTYKVMPLSPNEGLMEVVKSSTSLSDYLHKGANSAFNRYAHPKEWSYSACFHKMKSVAKSNHARKLRMFREVCRHHRPQFRHFFQETFPNACDWFQRRQNYARSVAVNSITGYVLGIGDRHCENILLDYCSGDLVHIDFGIVFDQASLLRVPETVPFRLTRNLVDGLGVLGTEGSFRRSCERALTVLRANTDNLLMILEVVVHDPLFAWTRSVPELMRHQKARVGDETAAANGTDVDGDGGQTTQGTEVDTDEHGNEAKDGDGDDEIVAADNDAARVLLRIRQKLRGQEDVAAEALGVAGQVDKLINDAMDPGNLCALYEGWGAWL